MVEFKTPANYIHRQPVVTCSSAQLPVAADPVEPPGLSRTKLIEEVCKDNNQVTVQSKHTN